MPIYEYECRRCNHRFELIQKFSDKPRRRCPECSGAVDRLISPPAIRFKGTGWYVTDYANKGNGESAKAAKGNGKSAEAAESSGATKSDGRAAPEKPAAKAEEKAS